jgi:choline dehydrogenase
MACGLWFWVRLPRAFDVVIVGGGAAGCVVAARLSSSTTRSALLLEAGPDLRAGVPDKSRDGWHINKDFCDWGYESEPRHDGVTEKLARSKLVGGTSWLTRFAVRNSPADYEEWVRLGNRGWSFEHVLPYFTRLEADLDYGDRPWHGRGGPIPVNRYRNLNPTDASSAGQRAFEAEGFPMVDDHNRPGVVGAGRVPMSSRNGVRVATADAYLPFGSTPPNLTFRPDAQVAAVVFDDVRAKGVRLTDGTLIKAG